MISDAEHEKLLAIAKALKISEDELIGNIIRAYLAQIEGLGQVTSL